MTEAPTDDPRWVFQTMLNAALVHGQRPTTPTILGPRTQTAIDVVARAHPDATADEIAVAYDEFAGEHGVRLTTE